MRIRILVMLWAAAALLPSCSERRDGPDARGTSIRVPNAVEESVSLEMNFDGRWTLDNPVPWLVISPKSGDAGTVEIRFTPIETHPDYRERTGKFTVDCNGVLTEYYVFQDGVSGVVVPEAVTSSGVEGGACHITVVGNVEYSASSESDWITVDDVTYAEPELLEDGVTESRLRTSFVNLKMAANGGDLREGTVSVVPDGEKYMVKVLQTPGTEAENRDFIRRTLVMKLTGTWCVNCPIMSEGIHAAVEQYPDHIVAMNMYDGGSGDLSYPDESYYAGELYRIEGYPACIVNDYADVANGSVSQNTSSIVSLAEEAIAGLPANTVIGGVAVVSSDSVSVALDVSAKAAGEHYVSLWLLEDGIVAAQTGASSDYVHDHVIRSTVTGHQGDLYLLESGVTGLTFRLPIPETVLEPDNLKVVAVVSSEGTYKGGLGGMVRYMDYGRVVDNVSEIPVNGTYIDFGYEN